MTKYIQTNENGYVVNVTDEPLLMGLFGGSSKNYRTVDDAEAENIMKLLKEARKNGSGLHINDIVNFKK